MTSRTRTLAVSLSVALLLGSFVVASPASAAVEDGRVSISGSTTLGGTLTAEVSGWPADADLETFWVRNSTLIDEGFSHVVTEDDLGETVYVSVRGTTDDDEAVTSAEIAVPLGTLSPGTVTISATTPHGEQQIVGSASAWGPGTVGLSYSWYRGDDLVGTGTSLTPYRTNTFDAGRSITLRVTGSKPGFVSSTISSAPMTLPKGRGSLSDIAIVGDPTVIGSVLSISGGVTTPAADSVVITWSRETDSGDGGSRLTPVSTGTTYTVSAADRGSRLRASIVATSAFYIYRTMSVGSAAVPGLFTAPKPKITGTLKVGKTLKVSKGSWSPNAHFAYQWYANGKAIKKATKTTLKLVASVKGKKITVKVTGTKTGYITASVTSKATKKVAAR